MSVTSPPQVRYPYAGRSRVAQSAERPAVNRQVIGSSPIAGASLSLHRQPSHLRQRRKRGYRHGARSARAEQDSHKIPTTGSRPGRQAGESSRTAPGRMLASGTGRAATRGGGPVIELECGSRSTRPARSRAAGERLAREWRAAAVRPAGVVDLPPVPAGRRRRRRPGRLAAASRPHRPDPRPGRAARLASGRHQARMRPDRAASMLSTQFAYQSADGPGVTP